MYASVREGGRDWKGEKKVREKGSEEKWRGGRGRRGKQG